HRLPLLAVTSCRLAARYQLLSQRPVLRRSAGAATSTAATDKKRDSECPMKCNGPTRSSCCGGVCAPAIIYAYWRWRGSGPQCWCGNSHDGRYGQGLIGPPSARPLRAAKQLLCGGGVWHNLIYETGFTRAHQYASQCFCGNKYGRYGKGCRPHLAALAAMARRTKLLRRHTCGGTMYTQLDREAEEFHSIGCATDDKALRQAYGFLYFGVQNSNQCFCGNKYGRYGKAAEGACNQAKLLATRREPAALLPLIVFYPNQCGGP
uniref:WSC domain-containing protein n=1 Tax=Macrostomum lignano TaxID=282301 RepID=A0A1I8FRW3_9PLAT